MICWLVLRLGVDPLRPESPARPVARTPVTGRGLCDTPLMHPRPLYRWKSFWLGVLVLGFIGWAWWDSFQRELMAYHVGNTHEVQLVRTEGASFVASGDDFVGELPGFGVRYPAGIGMERWKGVWELYGVRHHRIPDALVFFSFLGLWGGWLAWRWRRMRRATSNDDLPHA